MPQPATDRLVASFVRSRHSWSAHYKEGAIGVYNQWSRYLAAQGVDTVAEATADQCNDWLAHRVDTVSRSTAHRSWQLLGWLYEWLVDRGELPQVRKAGRLVDQVGLGPMDGAQKIEEGSVDPARLKRAADEDFQRLLRSFPKGTLLGRRNRAMLSLMYRSGLRRSEVARAELDRLDIDARTLQIHRKGRNGGKWMNIRLAHETTELIDAYLDKRGDDGGTALFASTFNGEEGTTTGQLKPGAISEMLERRCDQLGLDVTCHQLRRAWAKQARERGVPDKAIINQGGWAGRNGIEMLERYAGRDDEDAMALFDAADDTAPRAAARRHQRNLRVVAS